MYEVSISFNQELFQDYDSISNSIEGPGNQFEGTESSPRPDLEQAAQLGIKAAGPHAGRALTSFVLVCALLCYSLLYYQKCDIRVIILGQHFI